MWICAWRAQAHAIRADEDEAAKIKQYMEEPAMKKIKDTRADGKVLPSILQSSAPRASHLSKKKKSIVKKVPAKPWSIITDVDLSRIEPIRYTREYPSSPMPVKSMEMDFMKDWTVPVPSIVHAPFHHFLGTLPQSAFAYGSHFMPFPELQIPEPLAISKSAREKFIQVMKREPLSEPTP